MNVYSIPDLISKNSYSASGRTMDGVGTASRRQILYSNFMDQVLIKRHGCFPTVTQSYTNACWHCQLPTRSGMKQIASKLSLP